MKRFNSRQIQKIHSHIKREYRTRKFQSNVERLGAVGERLAAEGLEVSRGHLGTRLRNLIKQGVIDAENADHDGVRRVVIGNLLISEFSRQRKGTYWGRLRNVQKRLGQKGIKRTEESLSHLTRELVGAGKIREGHLGKHPSWGGERKAIKGEDYEVLKKRVETAIADPKHEFKVSKVSEALGVSDKMISKVLEELDPALTPKEHMDLQMMSHLWSTRKQHKMDRSEMMRLAGRRHPEKFKRIYDYLLTVRDFVRFVNSNGGNIRGYHVFGQWRRMHPIITQFREAGDKKRLRLLKKEGLV